jgi:hypothetical protein
MCSYFQVWSLTCELINLCSYCFLALREVLWTCKTKIIKEGKQNKNHEYQVNSKLISTLRAITTINTESYLFDRIFHLFHNYLDTPTSAHGKDMATSKSKKNLNTHIQSSKEHFKESIDALDSYLTNYNRIFTCSYTARMNSW